MARRRVSGLDAASLFQWHESDAEVAEPVVALFPTGEEIILRECLAGFVDLGLCPLVDGDLGILTLGKPLAVFALVVFAALVSGVVAYLGGERTGAATAANSAASAPRHQIYGDPATVEGLERGDFAAHLPRVGDQMLAVFAQPGKLMCARGSNPRRIDEKSYAIFEEYARNDLDVENDIPIDIAESREITELKQIVNGMREEMREYLANGNGTPRSYWRRLNERTAQEIQIYERTRRELEKETSEEVWEQKNDALRRLGLRTIPNPGE